MALSAQHRLRDDAGFKNVFKNGKAVKNSFFFIKYVSHSGPTKIAVSVSSKAATRAVDRNRLKRIVREWTRNNIPLGAPGHLISVNPLAPAVKANNDVLRQALVELFKKSQLI